MHYNWSMHASPTYPINQEASIRTFGVGLIALAALATVGLLLRRRRPAPAGHPSRRVEQFEELYAAGL